jgi:hypothetical protein
MGMKPVWAALAMVALAACAHKDIENKDAVRQAVVEYVTSRQAQTGLDMSTMDVDVVSMAFQEDSARATVAFRIKGTDSGMNMNYTLDRQGDHWVVRPPKDSDNPHGTIVPGSGTLPPGATLPPGHPQVGSKE